MEKTFVIFLHSSRYDRIYQAVNLQLTASSMGWRCYLCLFYEALATFVDGSWNDVTLLPEVGTSPYPKTQQKWLETLERGFELSNLRSLYDLLANAKREKGGLTVFACSASVKFLGLDPADVKIRVDEIVGLPTMWQVASKADRVLYI